MPKPTANIARVAGRNYTLPLFKVLLHNDDVNDMEHVVKALMKVFRFNRTRCEQIMEEAHKQGLALCVVEPLEAGRTASRPADRFLVDIDD